MNVRYIAPAVLVFGGVVLCLLATQPYKTPIETPETGNPVAQGVFGGVPLRIEVAESVASQEKGLGGRTDIPDGYGMLFPFALAGNYGFWMKDMEVPIDIFWLDAQGQVVTMKESVSPETYPTVFYPTAPSSYVLETRAGFGAEHGIGLGSVLTGLPRSGNVSR
ncbi:MAG: DUF192 domain-containing protein [bacterium]